MVDACGCNAACGVNDGMKLFGGGKVEVEEIACWRALVAEASVWDLDVGVCSGASSTSSAGGGGVWFGWGVLVGWCCGRKSGGGGRCEVSDMGE